MQTAPKKPATSIRSSSFGWILSLNGMLEVYRAESRIRSQATSRFDASETLVAVPLALQPCIVKFVAQRRVSGRVAALLRRKIADTRNIDLPFELFEIFDDSEKSRRVLMCFGNQRNMKVYAYYVRLLLNDSWICSGHVLDRLVLKYLEAALRGECSDPERRFRLLRRGQEFFSEGGVRT